MPTILSELYYLPPISIFAHYAKAEHIILEACEHYQKRSYRNRCHIIGANGVQRLSIFLKKGKNSKMPIKKVELAFHQAWPNQHWQSIQSAYGNAPFFIYYSEELECIYKKKHLSLWAFNLSLLECLFKLLQWDKTISETESYKKTYSSPIIDVRQPVWSRDFSNKKNTGGMNFTSIVEYPQVFMERHGFVNNLSILDLLFCMGPQCGLYLKEYPTSKEKV